MERVTPELRRVYADFVRQPSGAHEERVNAAFSTAILRKDVYASVKSEYDTNSAFRQLVDSETDAQECRQLCQQLGTTDYSREIVDCMCNTRPLFMRCRALMAQAVQTALGGVDEAMTLAHRRAKRVAACSAVFPSDAMSAADNCVGGKCAVSEKVLTDMSR